MCMPTLYLSRMADMHTSTKTSVLNRSHSPKSS